MMNSQPSKESKYANIRALYAMQAAGATLDELKAAAIEAAQTAATSYEKKQAITFMKGLDTVNKQDKAAARELYKRIRDLHPMNDKGSRRYWKSRYITAPNHAGLYIEQVNPDGLAPFYYLRQIARDSKQPILEGSGTLPYINTVPNTDGTGAAHHRTEWTARQALRLFTAAYEAAGARELYVWHNAHTVTDSRDTPGVVVFYTDHYKTSADVDTDTERNGQGARLWTN